MPYDIIKKHGLEKGIYIKMNRSPLQTRDSALKWKKENVTGTGFSIVPHSKVKSVGGGLYKYKK